MYVLLLMPLFYIGFTLVLIRVLTGDWPQVVLPGSHADLAEIEDARRGRS